MGFAEEFHKLDSDLMKQAIANVEARQAWMNRRGLFGEQATVAEESIAQASPVFMKILDRYNEAMGQLELEPDMTTDHELLRRVFMMLGAQAVGEVLAEYARLEREWT